MKLAIVRSDDGGAIVTIRCDADHVIGELEFWPGSYPSDAAAWRAAKDVMPGAYMLKAAIPALSHASLRAQIRAD